MEPNDFSLGSVSRLTETLDDVSRNEADACSAWLASPNRASPDIACAGAIENVAKFPCLPYWYAKSPPNAAELLLLI